LLIAAVGTSGSGKTTTIEYLISQFTNDGYKVGSIKHIYHKGFSFDKEGTNTWRFAKAGSEVTVAVSSDEMVIIKKRKSATNDLDQIIELLEKEKLDIIFIEGFHNIVAKRKDILKIVTAKDIDSLKRTLEGTVEPILAITGQVAESGTRIDGLKVPLIEIPSEGKQLLKFIERYLTKTE
jgi:molybdopterin-guanine dinucleotide biosynthesis protein B